MQVCLKKQLSTMREFKNLFYNEISCLHLKISLFHVNPLSANPEKWSNTLKQIVGNLPTICLSVFDHFINLALKGLKRNDNRLKLSLDHVSRFAIL